MNPRGPGPRGPITAPPLPLPDPMDPGPTGPGPRGTKTTARGMAFRVFDVKDARGAGMKPSSAIEATAVRSIQLARPRLRGDHDLTAKPATLLGRDASRRLSSVVVPAWKTSVPRPTDWGSFCFVFSLGAPSTPRLADTRRQLIINDAINDASNLATPAIWQPGNLVAW